MIGRAIRAVGWAALFGAMVVVAVPSRASTCFDRAGITDYDPALIKAIQLRLRDRNLYTGAIDGKVGSGTRAALARFTGSSPRSDFHLGSDMVKRIFGLEYSGIYYSEDQDVLLAKLGLEPDPNYRNPCQVHVVKE